MGILKINYVENLINNINISLNDEIDMYFEIIEKNAHNFYNNSKSIYNLEKIEIFLNILLNKSTYKLLQTLNEKIKIHLNDNFNTKKFKLDIDIEKLTKFKWNSSLEQQYKISGVLSEQIENQIDNLININISNKYLNIIIDSLSENIRIGSKVLKYFGLSKTNFQERHRNDAVKRMSGIILNTKIRLKKEIKNQLNCGFIYDREIYITQKTA